MILSLNGFALHLSLTAYKDGQWIGLALNNSDGGVSFNHKGIVGELALRESTAQINYTLHFTSPRKTRLRLRIELSDQTDLFHLIPGNIHGDNNAAHVRPGEFPCLTTITPADRSCDRRG